jgi:hypothetical protein
LDITPIAADDVKKAARLWVRNTDSSSSTSCTAYDRKSGHTVQLPCSTTKLPALCANSLPRYQIGTNLHVDKSKQIKVTTPKAGTYQGYRDQNQFRFLGIKYAQPPVGRLRFLAPQRITPGDVNKAQDATNFGFVCTQSSFDGEPKPNATEAFYTLGASESEDCLHLNVFTPSLSSSSRKKDLPVMVYIHGGGFTTFSGSSPVFEPGNLVSRGGVVVVTLSKSFSPPPPFFHSFFFIVSISRVCAKHGSRIMHCYFYKHDLLTYSFFFLKKNLIFFSGVPCAL